MLRYTDEERLCRFIANNAVMRCPVCRGEVQLVEGRCKRCWLVPAAHAVERTYLLVGVPARQRLIDRCTVLSVVVPPGQREMLVHAWVSQQRRRVGPLAERLAAFLESSSGLSPTERARLQRAFAGRLAVNRLARISYDRYLAHAASAPGTP